MKKSSWHPIKWILPCYLLIGLGSPLNAALSKRARVEVLGPVEQKVAAQLVKSTSIPSLPPGHDTWERPSLLKAIQEEVPRWIKVLHGFGYYDAQIRTKLRRSTYNWIIELQISAGPCYSLENILLEEYTPHGIIPTFLPITIELPSIASAEVIGNYEKEVLNYYRNSGYASAQITDKIIEIHSLEKTVKVKWILSRGHYYVFGPLDVLGLNRVHSSVIKRKVLFREGTPYNQNLIEQTQAGLENSGQFNEVTLGPNWSQEKEGRLPLLLSLSEAKRRSLAFGINMATDSGLGTKFLWENRNFTGHGDLLAFRALNSKRQKKAYWLYNRPDVFLNHTDMRCQLEFNDENTRAYNENNWEMGVFFERKLHKRLKFSTGPNLQFLKTTQTDDNSYKALLSLVNSLTWTNIENPLKPMQGRFHQLQITPFTTLEKNATTFARFVLKNGFYFPFSPYLTFGFGFQTGTLLGAARRDIPPPLRFFEGGPYSFRGYRYKTVSPLNDANKPIGGRSFLLYTFEPRLQVAEDFSVIPYFETGRVYTSGQPEPLKRNLRSVGLGLAWDTIVGPVRFDVAFPLDRRKSIDPAFQLYLSIGASL